VSSVVNLAESIPVGTSAERAETVRAEYTVRHHVPDMPAVLGTPYMIMLMEETARQAVAPHLPEGWLSVGFEVCIRHLGGAREGDVVTTRAVVTEAARNRIRYRVEARVRDAAGERLIGEGTHERVAVEKRRFET